MLLFERFVRVREKSYYPNVTSSCDNQRTMNIVVFHEQRILSLFCLLEFSSGYDADAFYRIRNLFFRWE